MKKKEKKCVINEKKKKMQNLKWATTHLSISTGSRYSHCIVTQRLGGWPLGIEGQPGYECHDTPIVS